MPGRYDLHIASLHPQKLSHWCWKAFPSSRRCRTFHFDPRADDSMLIYSVLAERRYTGTESQGLEVPYYACPRSKAIQKPSTSTYHWRALGAMLNPECNRPVSESDSGLHLLELGEPSGNCSYLFIGTKRRSRIMREKLVSPPCFPYQ